MVNYELTLLAQQDLDDLYVYGIRQWGLQRADTYYDALLNQLDQIAGDPFRYPRVDHIDTKARRRVFKSHAIYFELRSETVLILRIIGAQDISRIK